MDNNKISTRYLEICRPNGDPAITISCLDDAPYVRMYDTNGLEKVVIGIKPEGIPHISLLAEDGQTILGMGVDEKSGAGISIKNIKGHEKFRIDVDLDGNVEFGEINHKYE